MGATIAELDQSNCYRRREATQRTLADNAVDPHIARIHLDLAERYAAKASASQRQPSK